MQATRATVCTRPSWNWASPSPADAVEHSLVTQSGGELQFVTTKEYALALNEQDINKAVRPGFGGRPMRVKVTIGDPGTVPRRRPSLAKEQEDDVSRRALEHPEVQRFQELFPGGEVRKVRNLKE